MARGSRWAAVNQGYLVVLVKKLYCFHLFLLVLGSYCDAPGVKFIRQSIARNITQRDGGVQCHYEDVIITHGSVHGIEV